MEYADSDSQQFDVLLGWAIWPSSYANFDEFCCTCPGCEVASARSWVSYGFLFSSSFSPVLVGGSTPTAEVKGRKVSEKARICVRHPASRIHLTIHGQSMLFCISAILAACVEEARTPWAPLKATSIYFYIPSPLPTSPHHSPRASLPSLPKPPQQYEQESQKPSSNTSPQPTDSH